MTYSFSYGIQKKYFIMSFIMTLLLLINLPKAVHANWNSEIISATKSFSTGYPRGIDTEKTTNYPHIIYGGDKLYHTFYDGAQWQYKTIGNDSPVFNPTIAIDSNNKVHIIFSSGALKYTTNVSGSWVTEVIDSNSWNNISIAIDSNNKVHTSYYRQYCYQDDDWGWTCDYYFKYASNSTGSWVVSTLESGVDAGKYSSIAVDTSDKVHISYYDAVNDDLKYATNTSGSWVLSTIDSSGDVGDFTSIAVDSNDRVHISYHDNTNGLLRYATNVSGSWAITIIDSVSSYDFGGNTSLAIDTNNKVYIAYLKVSGLLVNYATNASGSWVINTLDSVYIQGSGNPNISIALDSNNKMHFSYYNDWDHDLKYANNISGLWSIEEIDNDAPALQSSVSVALDLNNKLHVSYVADGLMYATNSSGSWVTSRIDDSGGDVKDCTSISTDSNNKVHIAYCTVQNHWYGTLKYATNASGSWVKSTIYGPMTTHQPVSYVSLALDSNDKIHVSFRAYHLMYSSNTSGSWASVQVDNISGNGMYTSIALDSNNKAHISSFAGGGNYVIRYSTNSAGSWSTSTIDYNPGNSSCCTSIALDSNDKVHVSYYHSLGSDLYYITNESGFWVKTMVDNGGGYTSIVTDSNDKIHIKNAYSYFTNLSGSWATSSIGAGTGGDRSLAIDSLNILHTGYSQYGDLMYATNAPQSIIAAGHEHTLLIKPDGTLWAWGHNDSGQLGDGTVIDKLSPVQIGTDNNWAAVSAGWKHSLALKGNGTLWAWGDNAYGQLGDGTTTDRLMPVQIGSADNWSDISAGGAHNLALKGNGTLWTWGLNSAGQLGNGTTTTRLAPVRIGNDSNWNVISAGWEHSAAIQSNKALYTWGWNSDGQLGDGTTTDRYSPVPIGTADWIRVSAGWKHTVALKDNDTLYAWGDNEYGQLGDGTTTDSPSPVLIVASINNSWIIDAGGAHTIVRTSTGELWAWGLNSVGQLGDGTIMTRLTPVLIGGISDWDLISGGWEHTVSLKEDGSFWIWGWNTHGQLGDGTTSDRHSPITLNVPRAGFTGSPLTGDTPLTVDFTNSSGGLDYPFSYVWDFNNDGTDDSTLVNPSNIYTGPGTYTVKLSVSDADFDTDSLTRTNYITVCFSKVNIMGDSTAHSSLQSAYSGAQDTDTIQSRNINLTESPDLNRDISVKMEGGYDCLHSAQTGITTINGNITITEGLVTIHGGTIKVQ